MRGKVQTTLSVRCNSNFWFRENICKNSSKRKPYFLSLLVRPQRRPTSPITILGQKAFQLHLEINWYLPAGVRLSCLGLDYPYRIRPWVSLTFKTEQKVEQFLARITTTTVTAFQSYTEHQPRRSLVKGASDTV